MQFVIDNEKRAEPILNLELGGAFPDVDRLGERYCFNAIAIVDYTLRLIASKFKLSSPVCDYDISYCRNSTFFDKDFNPKDKSLDMVFFVRLVSNFVAVREFTVYTSNPSKREELGIGEFERYADDLPCITGLLTVRSGAFEWMAMIKLAFSADETYVVKASCDVLDSSEKRYLLEALARAKVASLTGYVTVEEFMKSIDEIL